MASLQSGTTVDSRYEIIDLLGRGRAGTVFSAKDILLSRTVALKFLNPALTNDSDFVTRFVREAQTLGGIDHQNIVRCFDLIPESKFGYYLVTELVEGISLEDLLKQQCQLPLIDALAIGMQICDAAEALRAKQLVHRDLKPSNVMLETRGEQKLVKIIDFGLVGRGQAVSADKMRLTKPDLLIGTPAFMSPEQIRGAEVDHRSDIFSIGCILHRLITGKNTVCADNVLETLILQLTKRPERLAASLGAVPSGLQEILDQAVEKSAERRWQTAEEFKAALEEIFDRYSNCAYKQILTSEQAEIAPLNTTYGAGADREEKNSALANSPWLTNKIAVTVCLALCFLTTVLVAGLYLSRTKSQTRMPEGETSQKSWSPIESLTPVKKFNAETVFPFVFSQDHGHWQARGFDVNNYDMLKLKTMVEDFPPYADARKKGLFMPGIVRLNNCSIDGGGNLNSISDLNIVLLDLSRTKIDDRALDTLKSFNQLTELNLKNSDLITADISARLSAVQNLSTLRVSGRNINSTSLDSLYRLKKLSRLELGEIKISAREVSALARIKNLRIVGFERCTIAPTGYKGLAGWKKLQQLQVIRMNVSEQDLDSLSDLNGLQKLDFVECSGLNDPKIRKLRRKLSSTQVQLFDNRND